MTRRRIIFMINSLAGGGAERVMCTLLRHSEAECNAFDVTLALLDDEPAAYTPPEWVKVRQLDARKAALRSAFAVRQLFEELRPDLTLSFLTRSNIANVINARCPCVISERANTSAHFPPGRAGSVQRALVRMTYPRASHVIAVSEGVAKDLRDNFGVDGGKITTLSNPIDMDAIAAKAAQRPSVEIEGRYVLAAGRLAKSKNFPLLIRAFAAVETDWKLVIAGEGEERNALLALAAELGVADRVILPGFIGNPYPLMRGADLFVLSSNAEGFPNALVEAMALGVPVAAANCPSGPAEILAEAPRESIEGLSFAKHGVLTPQNDVAAMAEALRAMADADTRRRYGQKASERAKAFAAPAMKDRYWDVLRRVMQP